MKSHNGEQWRPVPEDVLLHAAAIGADADDILAAFGLADALAAAVEAQAPAMASQLPRIYRRMELAGRIARHVEGQE